MSDFNVFMLQTFTQDDIETNSGFAHAVHNGELHISKGDVKITLNEVEIKQLSKAIGANFKR